MSKNTLDALSPDKRSKLIGFARYLGIQIPENEIMDRFCEASELYHLWPPPPECPKGWIHGLDVFHRWNLGLDSGEHSFATWNYIENRGGSLPSPFFFDSNAESRDAEYMLFLQIDAEKRAREQNRQFSRNP